jgi:predicted dehydrogenase
MEAYWTAFLPKFDVIRQLLHDGALGSVRTVIADHGEWHCHAALGFLSDPRPNNRADEENQLQRISFPA